MGRHMKNRSTRLRTGRRRYYDLFAPLYDTFIRLHSRREGGETRAFLAGELKFPPGAAPRILDVCCGTGAVVRAFAGRFPAARIAGCDFSHGMLRKARRKGVAGRVAWVEGDAARLPFADASFDAVSCSHALYELRGASRNLALQEMKRVVKPGGTVFIMEHEVPHRPVARFFFRLRMAVMGAADADSFIHARLAPFRSVFANVTVVHTPSGKSRLVCCRK